MNKIFLTSYDEANCFFSTVINLSSHIYLIDEEEMVIERVETLAEAHEFYNPKPTDFMGTLNSLIKALKCESHNATPSGLIGGGPLEAEELDLSGLKWTEFQDTGIRLHSLIAKDCSHERKHYQGFTEQYDYCDKCGAKNI